MWFCTNLLVLRIVLAPLYFLEHGMDSIVKMFLVKRIFLLAKIGVQSNEFGI